MAKADNILIRRLDIRRLMRLKMSTETILKELGISARTFYRDMDVIKEQNLVWINEMGRSEFLTQYRNSLESLEEQQRQLTVVAMTAAKDADKINARKAIAEIEVEIIEIHAYGSTVMSMSNASIPKREDLPPKNKKKKVAKRNEETKVP